MSIRGRIVGLLRKIQNTFRRPNPSSEWNLLALTPTYLEGEHAAYVKALREALENKQLRNIALSGNFGVGKSSILEGLARHIGKRALQLSLSSLSSWKLTQSLDASTKLETTKTNRIQQELVKQLLYSANAPQRQYSRFHRIEHFNCPRELLTSALIGVLTSILFLLTGWTSKIVAEFPELPGPTLWSHLATWGVATGLTFAARRLMFGRMHIKQLSAGPAAITLDKKSETFFDQYLDEIVYFFETSSYEVVIFEDIDRFEDVYIFETLRALNALLNTAPRIKRTIRFIYAIKDSIFDDRSSIASQTLGNGDPTTSAEAEAALEATELLRADRTKFFDLIIPVVPFITHQSARAIASELMKDFDNKVDRKLIDLAIQHVPDMRLLKNIRNEFVVFRDRILSGAGEGLKLDETRIFAAVLYKNTHLADFEKIRIGKSALDDLYKESRRVIRHRVSALQAQTRTLNNELSHGSGMVERSAELGARLYSYFETTATRAGFRSSGRIHFGAEVFSPEDLSKPDFWQKLSVAEGDPQLVWRSPNSNSVTIRRTEIAEELGIAINPKEWEADYFDTRKKSLEALNEELAFLKTADMKDLFAWPESYSRANEKPGASTFENIASSVLKSDLATALVRGGFITRNFTLYTATFPKGPETAAATNFTIHNIQRGIMDEYFSLSNGDAAYIIGEYSKEAIRDAVFYNIDIMNYLLSENSEYAESMMNSLMKLGPNEKRFIQAYLDSGESQLEFIAQFAAIAPDAYPFLISEAELEDDRRTHFVSHALSNLGIHTKYTIDDTVSDYLVKNCANLPVLTSKNISDDQAIRIAKFYASAGARVTSLEDLSTVAAKAFIDHDRYTITSDNIRHAAPSSHDLSLDSIAETPSVYAYVLQNLGAFLALPELQHTVTQADNLSDLLNDVQEHAPKHLDEVIKRMQGDVCLTDTSRVSIETLPSLARHNRFTATHANVARYITAFGDVDENLSKVLTHQREVTETNDVSEEDRRELALRILQASTHISAEVRAILAASLALKYYIPATSIPVENGVLFGLLVELHVIAAKGETYDHLTGTDWPTRELVLTNAVNLDSDTLTGFRASDTFTRDLAEILVSTKVNKQFKATIVSHADALIPISPDKEAALRALARYAATNMESISLSLVTEMSKAKARAQDVVKLLEPHLPSVSVDQLSTLLVALGGQYANLSKVGRRVPKVPNDPSHIALLERLKDFGIVSSYDAKKDPIEVYKKHKRLE